VRIPRFTPQLFSPIALNLPVNGSNGVLTGSPHRTKEFHHSFVLFYFRPNPHPANILFLPLHFLFIPQVSLAQEQNSTYLLPDNNIIPADKLDSLVRAWGGRERVLFSHNSEDDKNNIIHVIRATDDLLKQMAEARDKRAKTMNSMVNHAAAAWTATDINGKSLSLAALKGKVVVINFWFTSCSPCIQEMPHLNNLVTNYQHKGIVFIGFSFNYEESVRAFLKKQPFNYRQVANSKKIDSLYHIHSWPSFVIDKKGVVKYAGVYDENIETLISAAIDHSL
jgi:peroxiredoxin